MQPGSNPLHTYPTRANRTFLGSVILIGRTLSETYGFIEQQAREQYRSTAEPDSRSDPVSADLGTTEVSNSTPQAFSNPLYHTQQLCYMEQTDSSRFTYSRYEGEKGPAYYDWRQPVRTYLQRTFNRMRQAGTPLPLQPAMLFISMLECTKAGSTADTSLRLIRSNSVAMVEIVGAGYYPCIEPMEVHKKQCMRDNYGVPRYEQLFADKIAPLQRLLDKASARGWVRSSLTINSGTETTSGSSASAAQTEDQPLAEQPAVAVQLRVEPVAAIAQVSAD